MLIELLYVPGCLNHQPALRRLREAMRSEAVDAPIREIPVMDSRAALSLRFPGSPTVRINGLDAEPIEQQPFGLACRLYSGSDRLPSEKTLQRAISVAKEREENAGRNQRTR
jgi:hypothetical protein